MVTTSPDCLFCSFRESVCVFVCSSQFVPDVYRLQLNCSERTCACVFPCFFFSHSFSNHASVFMCSHVAMRTPEFMKFILLFFFKPML